MSISRYANVGQGTWTAPDGRQVPYLMRRLLPAAGTIAIARVHQVRAGERIDTIAAGELGDATLSWLVADANLAMRPTALARQGAVLRIPLPGLPGSASGQ
ncbi:MAG: hypothetical protein ACXVHB_16140 [Solirubrobacteraceae bacterium]